MEICTQIIGDLAQECCWSIGHYHCVYGEETDANQVPTEPSKKENNLYMWLPSYVQQKS